MPAMTVSAFGIMPPRIDALPIDTDPPGPRTAPPTAAGATAGAPAGATAGAPDGAAGAIVGAPDDSAPMRSQTRVLRARMAGSFLSAQRTRTASAAFRS